MAASTRNGRAAITWSEGIQQLHEAWERHAAGIPPKGGRRPPIYHAVADIQPNNEDPVALDVTAPDISRLAELAGVQALALIGEVRTDTVALVAGLDSLRSLSLAPAKGSDLSPLRKLSNLEHLTVTGIQLTSLAPLTRLRRLETLALADLGKLPGIDEIAQLHQLRWLFISGGMWNKYRLPTLNPLASLMNLECLLLISVRVVDGSLEPLTRLSRLHHLGLPNYFTIDQFARLAAALPSTIGRFRSPWFTEPYRVDRSHYTACKKCHEYAPGMTIGTPSKRLCPNCHSDRIAKHAANWNALVSAARKPGASAKAAT